MTLESFDLLRNIGQFDNVAPQAQLSLTPFTLIYAENGRGKTTIASILRSLGRNDPSLIVDRHRLGAQHAPHVVLSHQGNQHVFQNGSWNASLPNIVIFDDTFVSENVCSGIEIQTSHRQRLHELILGEQGVALNAALQQHVVRIEQHNAELREKADAIPAGARGDFTVNAFCALQQDDEIEAKIQEAERRLSAAKSEDAIRQRAVFLEISLPDFDLHVVEDILSRNLPALQADAAVMVQEHLASLGDGGESWVDDGMSRIEGASSNRDYEACPFCAQDLAGSGIIQHYQAYFSQAYDELKRAIRTTGIAIKNEHGGDVPTAFERAIRTATQNRDFWKAFTDVPEANVDTAAISRDWTAARDAVLTVLRAKAASPLEEMTLSNEDRELVERYRGRITEVRAISEALLSCNDQIALVKEQAAAADAAPLTADLRRVNSVKSRFETNVAAACDEYIVEKEAKKATETLRNQARTALDDYRESVFPAYEGAINEYLRRFNAGFRLGAVTSVNTRAGSSTTYNVVINNQPVDINAESGPSFKTTLSAGDRSTLALAFFFASLDQDQNLAQKIVIIDDPMTSLDEHRSLTTVQEMRGLFGRVQQMIVLSHSKPFLCALWDGADRNVRSALRLVRDGSGSGVVEWDVNADTISEHDHRHMLVAGYMQMADPAKERQVASALRPILEAFMRVAYPEEFPPGTLLGRFIGECNQRIRANNEILDQVDTTELRALLDYANRFHHDTNPAWETAIINDQELLDFARRVLQFTSRR